MKYLAWLVLFFLIGCEKEQTTKAIRLCYPQGDDALLIAREFERREIPHHFNERKKCITGGERLRDVKDEVELNAFGRLPPPGLSTTYRNDNQRFIDLLESNGIETETHTYKGTEYISWSLQDHEKAEELLKFEPWLREIMAEARGDARK